MADGSRTMTAELEADAAAAEAAREAKAEVLERAGVERAPPRAATAPKRAKTSVKTQWAEFTVDVWITNFNSVEFGIYKHSRNRAKSRQFTSDMDIFAEVIENGERTGLLGYREDLWTQEHRHGQAPGVQAVQRDAQLARHHGPDDRPQPAADAGCARPAGDVLLAQHRRPRQHGLSRALRQQVAAAARELLLLPARGRQAASSSACAATSSTSAATTRSTITTTSRSATSTARCSRSAASGRAG